MFSLISEDASILFIDCCTCSQNPLYSNSPALFADYPGILRRATSA